MERAVEIMWVLEYMDDLESDFSAIHGIRDMYTELDGPKFFKFATRIMAYDGVLASRAEALNEQESNGTSTQNTAAAPARRSDPQIDNPATLNLIHGENLFTVVTIPAAEADTTP